MGLGAIFVDGGNVSHSLKRRSVQQGTPRQKIEYGQLIRVLEVELGVTLAFRAYYTAHHDPALLEHRAGFYTHLKSNGWSVFDKPSKLCEDGVWRDKGIDMSIGLDAFALALKAQVDTIVLLTHDADFAELFRRLPIGVRGISVGFRGQTAMDLQNVSSKVLWIEDLGGVLR